MTFRRTVQSALLVAGLFTSAAFGADSVVAVLSSDLQPYQEALASFQQTLGRPVDVMHLAKGEISVPDSAKIIVAFGGKAATYPYPKGATLIVAMCPGILVRPDQHEGPVIKIFMGAPPKDMLSWVKEIYPSMKRFAIFWISPAMGAYNKKLESPAAEMGIEILSIKLEKPEDLPDRLRALDPKEVAIWLQPDPLLVTPSSVSTLKEYSRANNIPFFAPTSAFVKLGAMASITISFPTVGSTTADVVKRVLAGEEVTSAVFPEKITVSVNKSALEAIGQHLSDDVLRKMDEVFP